MSNQQDKKKSDPSCTSDANDSNEGSPTNDLFQSLVDQLGESHGPTSDFLNTFLADMRGQLGPVVRMDADAYWQVDVSASRISELDAEAAERNKWRQEMDEIQARSDIELSNAYHNAFVVARTDASGSGSARNGGEGSGPSPSGATPPDVSVSEGHNPSIEEHLPTNRSRRFINDRSDSESAISRRKRPSKREDEFEQGEFGAMEYTPGIGEAGPGPRTRAAAKRRREEEAGPSNRGRGPSKRSCGPSKRRRGPSKRRRGPSKRRRGPQVTDTDFDDPEDTTMADADPIDGRDAPYPPAWVRRIPKRRVRSTLDRKPTAARFAQARRWVVIWAEIDPNVLFELAMVWAASPQFAYLRQVLEAIGWTEQDFTVPPTEQPCFYTAKGADGNEVRCQVRNTGHHGRHSFTHLPQGIGFWHVCPACHEMLRRRDNLKRHRNKCKVARRNTPAFNNAYKDNYFLRLPWSQELQDFADAQRRNRDIQFWLPGDNWDERLVNHNRRRLRRRKDPEGNDQDNESDEDSDEDSDEE